MPDTEIQDLVLQTLTAWRQARRGRLPAALAMAGKMVRDLIGREGTPP